MHSHIIKTDQNAPNIKKVPIRRRSVSLHPSYINAVVTMNSPWSPDDWTASDDQVRGGSSYSILDCNPSSPTALFHGNLDTHTLGGAGFASQRTTGDRTWNLADDDGLELDIGRSDGKTYTITLKDTIPPKRSDGRDESTLSWEYDFRADNEKIFVKWSEFKPTYRGREQKDAKPLDLENIKRISLMMRR